MRTSEIIERVLAMEGIVGLNGMQEAMVRDDSRRLMLTAPTGSGKTIAFAIRLLREIDARVEGLQGVVLAPTRELVMQIAGVMRRILNVSGLRCVALYGGHDMRTEMNEVSVTPAVVVATPGRLVDHMNRRSVDVSGVRNLVIDEFDKCLQLGFQEQMGRIVRRMLNGERGRGRHVGKGGVVMLTSATAGLAELPDFMGSGWKKLDFCGSNVDRPAGGTEDTETSGSAGAVEVVAVTSPSRDKLVTLTELLRWMDNGRVIVFANHRESAERIFEHLMREGLPAVLYHGALDQQQRRMAVELLANGSAPVMVSTDLAARGLDIPLLDGVVHYHLPVDAETWTHRNGRTARQGAGGTVYVILSEGESLPAGVAVDRQLTDMRPSESPIKAEWTTLYINAGKKEKISKGDVAGYVMQKGGLSRDEVGRIAVDDHYAMVAVPAGRGREVASVLSGYKIKNRRVRVSAISN